MRSFCTLYVRPCTVEFQCPSAFFASDSKTIGKIVDLKLVICCTMYSLFHRNSARSATCDRHTATTHTNVSLSLDSTV